MKRVIKKAKITKGRTVDVEFVEHLDDKTERTHNVSCDQLYHNDLENAFEKLRSHLVCICDQKESGFINNMESDYSEELKEIKVTQFTISGNDDTEGVTIVGQKRIGEKVLNLISPFTMYEDEYKFAGELAIDINACVYEVEQYLFEGKYAVKQLEIPFEDSKDPDSGDFQGEANSVGNAVLSIVAKNMKPRKSKKQMMEAMPEVVEAESF
jgi:hypothetical protein